jgi:hypothetical protein
MSDNTEALTRKQLAEKLDRYEAGIALLATSLGWAVNIARKTGEWGLEDEERLEQAFRILRGEVKP